MRTGGRGQPSNRLRWIIGVALGLAALHVILALLWGRGDFVAVLTWYVPMIHSFLALAAASIAFIAFGRYQVLREPAPYWIGMAFVSYSILALFYVLSWPGLLPDERGLITQLSNTAAWIFDVNHIVLAILLLLAVLVPWPRAGAPGEHWWAWLVLANSLATALFGSLSVAFEQYIPTLVVDSVFTPFQVAAQSVMLLAFSAGVLLSTRRYSETGDPLLGYLAITQLALAFSALTAIIGEARYDTWWYWRRLLLVAGFSTMLFGLLSEYVGLYRREREKTIQLETLLRVTDPALAQHGLEMLLQALLEQMVTIMGAHAGVILLLDPEQHELVLRKQLGVAEEQALGFRVRVGENFAGRVFEQSTVMWVRDAMADPTVWSPYIRESHIRGLIGAPMRIEGECIGVMHLDFLVPREFTPEEERLLEVAAERAAVAIRQERLLEDAQEERNRLAVLIDTAPIGIGFYLAPDGRLEIINKAATDMLGSLPRRGTSVAKQAAFYGVSRPDGKPFPVEDLPLSRSLRGESQTGVEMLIHQPSGRQLYLLVNSSPLQDADARITGAVLSFQDITPIKEQELLRDQFLSTAAHELKTPVTTIKGYAQMLRAWETPAPGSRGAKAIDVINTQANRINQRVQEMLEAVRFRTAPPELHKFHFDLGNLASEVVRQVQDTTEIHRLLLKQDRPAPVEADRERIEEVLVSLIDNAIKYSPSGGDIALRVWADDANAFLSVTDHGVGISKDRQPHIFEPFYEAVPPGVPGYRGVVPLSLYLSKLNVERHGGRIWFESEHGKGSTFYLSLPLSKQESSTAPSPTPR